VPIVQNIQTLEYHLAELRAQTEFSSEERSQLRKREYYSKTAGLEVMASDDKILEGFVSAVVSRNRGGDANELRRNLRRTLAQTSFIVLRRQTAPELIPGVVAQLAKRREELSASQVAALPETERLNQLSAAIVEMEASGAETQRQITELDQEIKLERDRELELRRIALNAEAEQRDHDRRLAESERRQFQSETQRQHSITTVSQPAIPETRFPTTYFGRYADPTYRPPVGEHWVAGHHRSNGTFVQPHMRTDADDSFYSNFSALGNFNQYTGGRGTRRAPSQSWYRR